MTDGQPLIAADVTRAREAHGQRLEWLKQEYECQFVAGLSAPSSATS